MRRYLEEVIAKRHIEVIDQIANEDMIDEGTVAQGGPEGIEGLRAHVQNFYNNFGDDTKVTIHRLIANDDEVVAYWAAYGTQTGEFLGVPPTGGRWNAEALRIFDIRNGKIAHYSCVVIGYLDPPAVFNSSRAGVRSA